MNSSLMRLVIAKEATYGVAPIDFTTDPTNKKGFPVSQSFQSPIDFVEDANKVFIEETTGSQIEDGDAQTEGDYTVTASQSHVFGLHDPMVYLAMVFQNSYAFTKTITNGAITAISNDTNIVTLSVTDAGSIEIEDNIVITNRPNSDENGTYVIEEITGNDIKIVYVGGFDDGVLTGLVEGQLNTHEAMIESVGDCARQLVDNSFTIYRPKAFDKPDCSKAYGDYMTGLAVKTANLDFYASTYAIEMNGHQLFDGVENVPKDDTQYKEIIAPRGYFPINRPVVKIGGTNQKCSALTCNITMGLDESSKTRSAGRMDEVNVDRIMLEGAWSMIFKTEDAANNYSATFYKNRNTALNGAIVEFGIENNNGESLFIGGKVKFSNEKVTPEANGWIFSTNYKFCKSTTENVNNVTLKCKNGYNYSMAELFRTVKA